MVNGEATCPKSAEKSRDARVILIVDDDAEFNHLLADKLESEGFVTTKAFNGRDGFAEAKRILPDAIILDLRMPIVDGAETMNLLKKEPKTQKIPVLFCTSFNEFSGVKASGDFSEKIGAAGFIEKGAGPDKVFQEVKRIIALTPRPKNH